MLAKEHRVSYALALVCIVRFPADALKVSGLQHDRPTVSKAVARWLSGSGDRNGGRAERLVRRRLRATENVAPAAEGRVAPIAPDSGSPHQSEGEELAFEQL